MGGFNTKQCDSKPDAEIVTAVFRISDDGVTEVTAEGTDVVQDIRTKCREFFKWGSTPPDAPAPLLNHSVVAYVNRSIDPYEKDACAAWLIWSDMGKTKNMVVAVAHYKSAKKLAVFRSLISILRVVKDPKPVDEGSQEESTASPSPPPRQTGWNIEAQNPYNTDDGYSAYKEHQSRHAPTW